MLSRITSVFFTLLFAWTVHAFHAGHASVQTRNNADAETFQAIKRALLVSRNTEYSLNRTSIEKSWVDATLFTLGVSSGPIGSSTSSVELQSAITVVCTTCYINGSVSGSLSIGDGFNFTQAVDGIANEVTNVTETAFDQLEEYVEEFAKNTVENGLEEIPSWPTLDLDLSLDDIDGLPAVQVKFEFDDLEIYLALDVQLSAGATYTLNLFTSQTVAGFSIPHLDAGALFKVSLVLIAEAEIDISSGIHIKLDDQFLLNLEMFSKNVSGITLPGGRIEFLPVTIQGSQASLQALLQVEASVGVELASNSLASIFSFSAGVVANAFAYVADFLLTIDGSDTDDCELAVVAEYTLAVGAAAGATVAVFTDQWGPSPNTTVPVWYTTLASICADSKKPSTSTAAATITPRAMLPSRDDLVTTTISTSSTYTIVKCRSPGLVNCPVYLQDTRTFESTMTTVLTVPSGVDPTFPASTFASVTAAIPFGDGVRQLGATSGTPTPYTPSSTPTPTPTSTADSGVDSTSADNHSNNNKLIIGLSVGLGVPALIGLVAGVWWFLYRRKKYTPVPAPETIYVEPAK